MGRRDKRIKDYWIKRTESFSKGTDAQERAAELRNTENVSHVLCDGNQRDGYVVSYSVARWYAEEQERLGIRV